MDNVAVLRFDGACQQGRAGCGYVLYDCSGALVSAARMGLCSSTNNQAEWHGLLLGLECAHGMGLLRLAVEGDSLLVINQFLGLWACFDKNLIH
eukprot:9709984-Karenia_brevis.AAC.1